MKRALKLLIVSSDKFPPFRVDVTELFGQQMTARGHVIDWLLQSEQPCSKPYRTAWSGGQVWVGSTNNGSTRLARLGKHMRAIANDLRMFRLLRENRYDLVQVKDKFVAALLALVACRLRGVPMVYWLSYPFPESDLYEAKEGTARYPLLYWIRGSVFKWLLYRVILRFAAHGFVQSEQMKRDVVRMGIRAEKLTAVPMGVAASLLSIQLPPAVVEPERNVAYLGTLARKRRLDMIVRAFRRVVDAVPNAKLFLVGAGDDPEDVAVLKREVRRLDLEGHVSFTGFLPRDRAVEVVARALVCLSPFYPTPIFNSTSPTKLIEYMALGRAVVGNHHPEQRMLIEESQGGLSVEWDEGAFADAMIALLTDPARAIEMGRRGQRYVREHRTYERIAAAVESRYMTLCAPSSRVPESAPAE